MPTNSGENEKGLVLQEGVPLPGQASSRDPAARVYSISGTATHGPRISTLDLLPSGRHTSALSRGLSPVAGRSSRCVTSPHSLVGSVGTRGLSIVPRRVSGGLDRSESFDVNLLKKMYAASRPGDILVDLMYSAVESVFLPILPQLRNLCANESYDDVDQLLFNKTRMFVELVDSQKLTAQCDHDGLVSPSRATSSDADSGQPENIPHTITNSSCFSGWLIEFLFILWYSSTPSGSGSGNASGVSPTSVDSPRIVSYTAIRQVCKQIVNGVIRDRKVCVDRSFEISKCCGVRTSALWSLLPWRLRLLCGEVGPNGESSWSEMGYDPFVKKSIACSVSKKRCRLHWLTREFETPYLEKSFQVDFASVVLLKRRLWTFAESVAVALCYLLIKYTFLKKDYPSLTFIRLLITEPVCWVLVAAIFNLVNVTVLFTHSVRFKENYFAYQFFSALILCSACALWMYLVRRIFVFIAWPLSEGFTMGYILINANVLFYVRFIYLNLLVGMTAVFTVLARLWLCDYSECSLVSGSLPLQQTLALLGALLLVLASRFVFETHSRFDFYMYRTLYRESERNEKLLLNILPAPVIQHLKTVSGNADKGMENVVDGPCSHQRKTSIDYSIPGIAEAYDKVTVLFTDVVGFTSFSSQISPEQLVLFLNDLFTEFDSIAEQTGMEKIKTIGDAYMCVSGLPEPNAQHAAAAARMGVRIAELMKSGAFRDHNDRPVGCRIGMHSGSVVAGVIGRKKFIYDIWGDAVNTASRMESTGEENAVHCSEETAKLIQSQALPGEFVLKPRGEISVKGKGNMKTFWVRNGT